MSTTNDLGQWGEKIAAATLECIGYSVIEQNWRPSPSPTEEPLRGEIDLVLRSPENHIVFVEVKTRSTQYCGHPFEAITPQKSQKLKHLAYAWCTQHARGQRLCIRIDAVAVTGNTTSFTVEHLQAVC